MPSAVLIVNLGVPFRIRAGNDIETAEYADGCAVTTPPRVGVRLPTPDPVRRRALQAVAPAPFLPMPAAELCDRPVTVEQVGAGPPLLSCEIGWPRRAARTRC
jgi:hypothetical protein